MEFAALGVSQRLPPPFQSGVAAVVVLTHEPTLTISVRRWFPRNRRPLPSAHAPPRVRPTMPSSAREHLAAASLRSTVSSRTPASSTSVVHACRLGRASGTRPPSAHQAGLRGLHEPEPRESSQVSAVLPLRGYLRYFEKSWGRSRAAAAFS